MNEHQMQCSIMAEVALRANQEPQYELIFAIPNGGHRNKATAGKLKAEGVRAGLPDLCWPIARGRYHGLFMELKVGANRCSPEQNYWLKALIVNGYYCCIVRDDPAEAMQIFDWYYEGAT